MNKLRNFVFLAVITAVATLTVAANPIFVSNVEELYAVVNDPANAGATVTLAPGTYVLTVNGPGGTPRPNGGRIELQENMSLLGVIDDRAAVVIDGTGFTQAQLTVPVIGRTGFVRIGRGANSIEWLTVTGRRAAASSIDTDLVGQNPAQIRVAHVASFGGSTRGVNVRNVGAAQTGRTIDAEIIDNDFSGGFEGVRIVNSVNANNGVITVRMSGNYMHENENGCLAENTRASFGSIYVRSDGDLFENNGAGCVIGAALIGAVGSVANGNTTIFEAHGSKFINNNGLWTFDRGGIVAFGAETPNVPNAASNNTITIRLWGCKLYGNQNSDLEAYGARAVGVPEGSVGTNNRTTIELYGVSKFVEIIGADSVPFEPAQTNTVTIIR